MSFSFFKAFGGEGKTSKGASLTDKLMAIGGSSERSASGVNIAAAARRMKVNTRTVRGWLNEGKNPSPKSQKRLTTLARNAERTKTGRQAAVERGKARGTFTGVTRVNIDGTQGPGRSGQDYSRDRLIRVKDVTADDVDQLQQAYINGGDRAAAEAFSDLASRNYLHTWNVQEFDGVDWE